MKKAFIIYFTLIPLISFAQAKGDIAIEWLEKKEMYFGDFKINVPLFTGKSYSFDSSEKSIYYILNLTESGSFDGNSIQITNVIYESVLASQLGDLALENIPKTPSATLKTNISRDIKQLFLVLSPIIKDDLGYKRIKFFSYSVNGNASRISQTTSKSATVVTNSVLATGDWYQFYIEKSGVYKISKSFLQQLGLNTSTIDPRKLKIYGNGGRMLPLSNSIDYPYDLTENAIQVVDESDGVFNNNDYILFYAEGVDTWNEESQTNTNLYDTKSYYYITVQGGDGKRISNMVQPTGIISQYITSFDDYQYHELDLINILNLGRQWFGESFDINQEQEFSFNFPKKSVNESIILSIILDIYIWLLYI